MIRFSLRLLGLLAVYSWWVEPARLSITDYEVSMAGCPLTSPVRALLLTDWHLGRFTQYRFLRAKIKRLLRRHRRQPFDLVLLGGDYIDDDPRCLSRLVPILKLLAEFGIPFFAVLGNHDYTSFPKGVTPLVGCLKAAGITVLRNEAQAVTVGGQRLLIVGLEDLQEAPGYFQEGQYRTPEQYRQAATEIAWYTQFDNREPDTPRLLLAHNPDAVYLPGRTPLAVLAGHTHGGQIMLLDWVSRRFHRSLNHHLPPGSQVTWAGRQETNGRTLIVSRGIEGAALPVRLLRPPEAVILTFR